jgi:hypothetical protein
MEVPMRALAVAIALAFAFAASLAACGPSAAGAKMPSYPKESTLKNVGQRCGGALCACRPLIGGDQEEQAPPPAGKKRFEIRIPVTVHPVWVNVPGAGTLFKGPERGEETCAYVDLAPGEHEITYMIKERNKTEGFAALLRLFEYGRKTKAWYEAFAVDCGVADSACNKPGIQEWAKTVAAKQGNIDNCSSTRFKDVQWASNEWEGGRLQELAVTFRLKVYKFEPTRAPKSQCVGKQKDREGQPGQPAEGTEPPAEPGATP